MLSLFNKGTLPVTSILDMKIFFIVLLILALMSFGIWLLAPNYFMGGSDDLGSEPVACTMDARMCPDGS